MQSYAAVWSTYNFLLECYAIGDPVVPVLKVQRKLILIKSCRFNSHKPILITDLSKSLLTADN